MSNDWSDGPGSNDNLESSQSPWESPNTTDPGEPGANWHNEPSGGFTPMGKAGVGDVFNNFGTVLSRSMDSGITWAYLTLVVVQFVTAVGGVVALFMMGAGLAGLISLEPNLAALGSGVVIAMLIFVVVMAIPQYFMIGLANPFRIALFEGQQPHHGLQWALGRAAENILDLFLLTLLCGVLFFLLFLPGIGLSVLVSEWLLFVWAPIPMVAGFLLAPAIWYAATGHGVLSSITKAFSTVMNNLFLFFVLLLIAAVGFLAVFCLQMALGFVLAFIPVLGQLISFGVSAVIGFLGWIFYVTVFATVDSHQMGRPLY